MNSHIILQENAHEDLLRVQLFGRLLGALEIEGFHTFEDVEKEAKKHFVVHARIFGRGRRNGPYCVNKSNMDYVVFHPFQTVKSFNSVIKKIRRGAKLTIAQASSIMSKDKEWLESVESGSIHLDYITEKGVVSILEEFANSQY